MFSHKIDDEAELRLLELHHARQFFELAHRNRAHIGEWMFWITDDYSIDDARKHIQAELERFASHNGFEVGIWSKNEL
ncbi:MAG: RimJ/RimL family protein N-acetyltransferase, partial [Acidobacteria bacterium]|nr:RimJ/RimL family protein N-acetyltransferase [Acidobacteriota bacterium]